MTGTGIRTRRPCDIAFSSSHRWAKSKSLNWRRSGGARYFGSLTWPTLGPRRRLIARSLRPPHSACAMQTEVLEKILN